MKIWTLHQGKFCPRGNLSLRKNSQDEGKSDKELANLLPPENDANQYDRITIGVQPSEDEFNDFDSDDGSSHVVILKHKRANNTDRPSIPADEEIPPEVIEQLKQHPQMQEFIADVVEQKLQERSRSSQGTTDMTGGSRHHQGNRVTTNQVKSPSDTTLYRPALNKGVTDNDVINKISNFVENMCIFPEGETTRQKSTPLTNG